MKYKEKRKVVDALQWTGTNKTEMAEMMEGFELFYSNENLCIGYVPEPLNVVIGQFVVRRKRKIYIMNEDDFNELYEVKE